MAGRTRGLTLIEILIVIGLLGALAAIALPALLPQLDARAFDAGGDVIQRHIAMSRAHARRTRSAVELVYEIAERRMIARPFDVEALDGDAPAPPPLATAWSVRELPGRVVLSRRPLPDLMTDDEAAPDETSPTLRVAVFLADGSALVGDPLWLTDDGGRRMRLTLNPMTGAATLDSGEDVPVEEAPDDEDEPDDEPEAEDADVEAVADADADDPFAEPSFESDADEEETEAP